MLLLKPDVVVCMTHAHVLVIMLDSGTSCDDVTVGDAAVVMTTVVGVACFMGGALAGALLVGVICRRRPTRYFVSRMTKTNMYRGTPSSSGALPLRLPSPDCGYSSMDAEDVFLTVTPPHQLTVSDACLQRQLMLKSTDSFRSMRTKLDSVDDDQGL